MERRNLFEPGHAERSPAPLSLDMKCVAKIAHILGLPPACSS